MKEIYGRKNPAYIYIWCININIQLSFKYSTRKYTCETRLQLQTVYGVKKFFKLLELDHGLEIKSSPLCFSRFVKAMLIILNICIASYNNFNFSN